MRSGTRIIDSNVAIALGKRARGLQLLPLEEAFLKRFDALGAADVRVADRTIAEGTVRGGPLPQRGFAVSVDRAGPEYQALLAELTNARVGAVKGTADRQIVADAFFAVGEPGAKPSLATPDADIYNRLYRMKIAKEGGIPLAKLGAALPEADPAQLGFDVRKDGFDVTVNGRTLNVLPLPKR
ncbi:hypothetical protein [Amycolatopsis sp. cg13]|uniref:hypothetical protein n=1 Tax=Amycolatopsis sp. cg13 TaxID=3238807 RepID=UPI0035269FEF